MAEVKKSTHKNFTSQIKLCFINTFSRIRSGLKRCLNIFRPTNNHPEMEEHLVARRSTLSSTSSDDSNNSSTSRIEIANWQQPSPDSKIITIYQERYSYFQNLAKIDGFLEGVKHILNQQQPYFSSDLVKGIHESCEKHYQYLLGMCEKYELPPPRQLRDLESFRSSFKELTQDSFYNSSIVDQLTTEKNNFVLLYEHLKMNVQEDKKSFDVLVNTNKQLENRIQKLNRDLNEQKVQLDLNKIKLQELTEKNLSLNSERQNLINNKNKLLSDLNETQKLYSGHNLDVGKLDTYDTLLKEHSVLEKKLDLANANVEDLKTNLSLKQEELQKQNLEYSSLVSSHNNLQKKYDQKENECIALQTNVRELNFKNKNSTSSLTEDILGNNNPQINIIDKIRLEHQYIITESSSVIEQIEKLANVEIMLLKNIVDLQKDKILLKESLDKTSKELEATQQLAEENASLNSTEAESNRFVMKISKLQENIKEYNLQYKKNNLNLKEKYNEYTSLSNTQNNISELRQKFESYCTQSLSQYATTVSDSNFELQKQLNEQRHLEMQKTRAVLSQPRTSNEQFISQRLIPKADNSTQVLSQNNNIGTLPKKSKRNTINDFDSYREKLGNINKSYGNFISSSINSTFIQRSGTNNLQPSTKTNSDVNLNDVD